MRLERLFVWVQRLKEYLSPRKRSPPPQLPSPSRPLPAGRHQAGGNGTSHGERQRQRPRDDDGPSPVLRPSIAMNYNKDPSSGLGAARLRLQYQLQHKPQQHQQNHLAHMQQQQPPPPSPSPPLSTAMQCLSLHPMTPQLPPLPPPPSGRGLSKAMVSPDEGKMPKKGKSARAAAPGSSSQQRPASKPRSHQKKRSAPSPASGGIPEPTLLYLTQALAPVVLVTQPRRILVIVDLNGTLLYRPNRTSPTSFVERPHARRFIESCLDSYSLAIWSSARPENVRRMLNQLLTPDQRQRCVDVWGRDRLGLCEKDYNARVQCYKRLSVFWADPTVQASHPATSQGARWDQSNTVLVDDSPEKGRSEPYNILALPEFLGSSNDLDLVLPQVRDYLNTLCYQRDISTYMRLHPFTLDPTYQISAAFTQMTC